jgi:TRAP-type mannitol/chloroaromatic compound transport system permease small subunit
MVRLGGLSWSIVQMVIASVTGVFMILSGICFIIYQCTVCLKEAFVDEVKRKEIQHHGGPAISVVESRYR